MSTIHVRVVPNAKRDGILGDHGSAIKIKVRAPAVAGRANSAVCKFLADRLQLPARDVVIQRGEKSRHKIVQINGLDEAEIRLRLLRSKVMGSTESRPAGF